jgi:hypothetical protein
LLKDAEEIIFFRHRLLRKYDATIDEGDVLSLLRNSLRDEELPAHLTPETRMFLLDSVTKLLKVANLWANQYNPDDQKHVRALQIMAETFSDDRYMPIKVPSSKKRGRQLTEARFWSEVKRVRNYMRDRERGGRKDWRFYKESRFYYITALVPLIYLSLDLKREERQKKMVREIKRLFDNALLPYNDVRQVVAELAEAYGLVVSNFPASIAEAFEFLPTVVFIYQPGYERKYIYDGPFVFCRDRHDEQA